jgi:hypothetical protein
MGTLPRDRLGSGGGMLATARVLGQETGIAIASALFRARGGAGGRFLAGYATALGAGAALALAAGLAVLVRDRRGRAARR